MFNPSSILLHPLAHFGLPFHAPPEASRTAYGIWLAPHLKIFHPSCEKNENPPLVPKLADIGDMACMIRSILEPCKYLTNN